MNSLAAAVVDTPEMAVPSTVVEVVPAVTEAFLTVVAVEPF
jgi:hypothetical protein